MIKNENKKARILIVDDELSIRKVLCGILGEAYDCAATESAEQALSLLKKENFNLVISDINMGKISGIEMIPRVFELAPETVVMMISGNQTVDCAIEAMRVGAFDFIKKPFELEHVEAAVCRAIKHQTLIKEKRWYENHLEELIAQKTVELNYLAYYDALTDLPNRTLFEDRLSQTMILARGECSVALLLLSIGRLKEIQDTLGRSTANKLLQKTAKRLVNCVDESVTIARLEGDEFAVLLSNVNDTQEIIKVVNEINDTLQNSFFIEDREIYITANIGISLFLTDGDDPHVLLKNAGAALSRAKEKGGNNYRFYTADMNDKAVRRLTLENDLRRALEREEFEVYYQPKVDFNTEKITGAEALVRWRHPEKGFISPGDFIPLAEETGLIVPLGEWILRTACAQNKLWRDEGFSLNLSVNLSTRQFEQPNLSDTIIRIIRETGAAPGCLNLEITESSIMKNADAAIKTLGELKKTGIKISIDDFGTGYSSLVYLKHLPIDVLKIDRSFIRDVTTDADDAALVMTIISLAHNLKLKVIAEGIETEEQLKLLRLLRCNEWQGFLCSKPVSSDSFRQILFRTYR